MMRAITNYAQRTSALQVTLQPHQAILLSSAPDIHYFSGFAFLVPEEREAFFVVTSTQSYLLYAYFSPLPSDRFFTAKENCQPTALAAHLKEIAGQHDLKEILVDTKSLFVEEYQVVETALKNLVTESNSSGTECILRKLDTKQIWKLRMVKDANELSLIRTASGIAQNALSQVMTQLQEGLTEKQVATLLENAMREHGAQGLAFPTIVAFGPHGALPHHQPGDTTLKPDTAVLIDCGALYQGYRSDMTRTFWFGKKTHPEFIVIKKLVLSAYQQALSTLQSKRSLLAKDIDAITRTLIKEGGYAEYFIHTSGHGIGLDIHEPPSLNWRNETVIEPGMVITIEPGIYLEGKFGFRYENTVLIREDGVEELTLGE